jgi:hypothetical protein
MTSPTSNPSFADFPVIDFNREVMLIAQELEEKMTMFPGTDPRKVVLWAIGGSGSMLDLAHVNEELMDRLLLYSGDLVDQRRDELLKRRENLLSSESKNQNVLLAAGIKDDATALEWLESIRESVDRDAAELEALEARHRVELNEFFQSKGAPTNA